jgi:hypothetical protein
MGKEFTGPTQRNSAETSFVEFLEANLKETEMNNFRASLAMNQDQMLGRVNELMYKHTLYKVDRNNATARVQRAWEIMDDFLASKSQYLQENGITPVVYGSMTFDDPATFDFDLCLVGMSEREDVEADLDAWTNELWEGWEQVGTKGHIHYTNLEKLERYVKAFHENNLDVVDEEDFDIFLYLFYGSSVLIGSYIYSEGEEENIYKEKYLEAVKQSPSLLAYTIFNLEQSLIERETRRAGIGDHQTGEDNYKQQLVIEERGIDPQLIAKLQRRWTGETEDEG